jgi:hypothetical protein
VSHGDGPLVIVGSRLQALIFALAAIAVPLGLWEQLGTATLLAALPLAVAAALTLHRRVELHGDSVLVRHRFRPTAVLPRSDVQASAGHRYLRLDSQSHRIRIEVPVEIRPEVRDWADGLG